MAKRADSLYRRGRSRDWLKIKTTHGRAIDEERAKWNERSSFRFISQRILAAVLLVVSAPPRFGLAIFNRSGSPGKIDRDERSRRAWRRYLRHVEVAHYALRRGRAARQHPRRWRSSGEGAASAGWQRSAHRPALRRACAPLQHRRAGPADDVVRGEMALVERAAFAADRDFGCSRRTCMHDARSLRSHRPLAGIRAQRPGYRNNGTDRPRLREAAIAVARPIDTSPDVTHGDLRARGVLISGRDAVGRSALASENSAPHILDHWAKTRSSGRGSRKRGG